MKSRFDRQMLDRLRKATALPLVIARSRRLYRSGNRTFVGLCPFHREETPSFTVYQDHFHCFGCGHHGDVFDWLRAACHLTLPQAVHYLTGLHPQSLARAPHPRFRRHETFQPSDFFRVWREGIDPRGTLTETYLASRGGLRVPDGGAIRFHPRCQRGGRDTPGGPDFWPAMLALMTDPISGTPVGVHRTFLLPDGSGKAPIVTRGKVRLGSKMILGTWGVIRLAPDEEIGRALAIAEGIENALTASQIIGWGPVWAAGSQAGLSALPVLPGIEGLTIFADADDEGIGISAARACATRWSQQGREVIIHIPEPGTDWNANAMRDLA